MLCSFFFIRILQNIVKMKKKIALKDQSSLIQHYRSAVHECALKEKWEKHKKLDFAI